MDIIYFILTCYLKTLMFIYIKIPLTVILLFYPFLLSIVNMLERDSCLLIKYFLFDYKYLLLNIYLYIYSQLNYFLGLYTILKLL